MNYQPGSWEVNLGPLQEQQLLSHIPSPKEGSDNYIKARALMGTNGLLYKKLSLY